MTYNTHAIATKLNILDSAVLEIQEWASVLFVKFTGGCRFVSKKIGVSKMKITVEKQPLEWVCRSEVPTANRHFPENAWVSINKNGIIKQSKEAVGTKAPSQELMDFALSKVAEFYIGKIVNSCPDAPVKKNPPRTACLNCGITNTILMGRGYCTDCHGEC